MAWGELDIYRVGRAARFYLTANHFLRHLLGERGGRLRILAGLVITWLAVVIAWVVFRANSLEVALAVLKAMWHMAPAGTLGTGLLGGDRIMSLTECWSWIAVCASISLLLPNVYQVLGKGIVPDLERRLIGIRGGVLTGALLGLSLVLLAVSETRGMSEFLYFNF